MLTGQQLSYQHTNATFSEIQMCCLYQTLYCLKEKRLIEL